LGLQELLKKKLWSAKVECPSKFMVKAKASTTAEVQFSLEITDIDQDIPCQLEQKATKIISKKPNNVTQELLPKALFNSQKCIIRLKISINDRDCDGLDFQNRTLSKNFHQIQICSHGLPSKAIQSG
jgi:hypothetical protein